MPLKDIPPRKSRVVPCKTCAGASLNSTPGQKSTSFSASWARLATSSPRYNIAPTDTIDVIIPTSDGLQLALMRWGLVPAWWKKTAKEAPASFDARGDRRQNADVALRVQEPALPHSGLGQ
jgi:putative SOS response-associated peptidase YedK